MTEMRKTGTGLLAAGLVLALGTFTLAQDQPDAQADKPAGDGDKTLSLSVKSDFAKKYFFGFDLQAGVKKLEGANGKPEGKDVNWVPDTVVPAISQGGQVPPIQGIALGYKIILNRNGYVTQVPESFVFQSGDQFRLVFQSNLPATMQILNKGTSGGGKVLFPDPRIYGGANQIPAYQEAVVPPVGWFQFDNTPGTEDLILVVTPQATVAQLPPPVQQFQQECRPGAVISQQNWNSVVTNVINIRHQSCKAGKTKDIFFVDEGQSVIPPSGNQPPAPANDAQPGGVIPAPPVAGQGQPLPTQTSAMYAATTTVDAAPLLIHTMQLNHK
jgi:hypothetical protein